MFSLEVLDGLFCDRTELSVRSQCIAKFFQKTLQSINIAAAAAVSYLRTAGDRNLGIRRRTFFFPACQSRFVIRYIQTTLMKDRTDIGIDQVLPGIFSDIAVCIQPVALLEIPDSFIRIGIKSAVYGNIGITDRLQITLKFLYIAAAPAQ